MPSRWASDIFHPITVREGTARAVRVLDYVEMLKVEKEKQHRSTVRTLQQHRPTFNVYNYVGDLYVLRLWKIDFEILLFLPSVERILWKLGRHLSSGMTSAARHRLQSAREKSFCWSAHFLLHLS